MPSKPTVGGSNNTWGTELNAFLDAALASDGNLKDGVKLGANPSTTGSLNMPNAKWLAARNAANGGDVFLVRLNASDLLELGAALNDIKLKGGPWFDARSYGFATAASAATNTAAVASAITDAKNAGGGRVYLHTGVYSWQAGHTGLATSLTDTENVQLISGGGSQNGPYGAAPTAGTVLKATTGSGAMLTWAGTTANSLRGCGIDGIAFDANLVASTGIKLDTLFCGRFIGVHVRNATSVGVDLTSNGVSDVGLHGCYFESLTIACATNATAKGLRLAGHAPGAGNGDVSCCKFMNTFVYTDGGTGIEFGYADGNLFYATLVNRAGTALGVDFLGSNTAGLVAFENVFDHLDAVGGVTARGTTSYTNPSHSNTVRFSTDNATLIPTIEAGATMTWTTTGGVSMPEYRRNAFVEDDFIGGLATTGQIGQLGWATAGGTTTAPSPSGTGHPGTILLDTTAAAGTLERVHIGGNGSPQIHGVDAWDVTFMIKLTQTDSDTMARIGMLTVMSTDPPDDGMWIEKVYADTSWFGVTRSSTTQTRTAALAATSTNWVTLRIRRFNSGNSVGFSVNGGTEVVNTTNLTGSNVSPAIQIKNQSAASKTLTFDYFSLQVIGLTRA